MSTTPEHIWSRLRVAGGADLPWSWDSLDEDLFDSLSVVLVDFVCDYNNTFVVKPGQLIPSCWPAHPGLAREIAALYATWITAFHQTKATPPDAAYWYDRTLPGFQDRITMWLGRDPDACRAGQHPDNWNDVAAKIGAHNDRSANTLERLRSDGYAHRLSSLATTPVRPQVSEDTA